MLSDGNAIPPGMRITLVSERAFDSQTSMLGPDGSLAFGWLAKGTYTVFAWVRGYDQAPASQKPVMLDDDVTKNVLTLDRQ